MSGALVKLSVFHKLVTDLFLGPLQLEMKGSGNV